MTQFLALKRFATPTLTFVQLLLHKVEIFGLKLSYRGSNCLCICILAENSKLTVHHLILSYLTTVLSKTDEFNWGLCSQITTSSHSGQVSWQHCPRESLQPRLIALVTVEPWDVQTLLATALEQQRRTLAKETTRRFTCGLVVWPRGFPLCV